MALSAEDEEIMRFLRSEQDAYYRGDFEAFIRHWHHGHEVRRILSGPQVGTRVHIGWEDLRAKFEEGFRQHPQNFDAAKILRWENVQIQKSGDMAWVTYDQIATEYHPGMHVSPLSHEVKIVQRIDDEWKIVCLVVAVPDLGRRDVPQIEMDQYGKVVGLNELASERLPKHKGLTISGNRPRAQNRSFDKVLQESITHWKSRLATNLPRGFLREPASVVLLGDDPDGLPMFCWIHCEQEHIVLSFDDRTKLRESLESGGSNFKLSAAQIKVAEQIALGRDLATAADALGVSSNTVRTQLRRMFEKTQTHNQATLISRILNSRPPV
ncbi:Bacterial regulatory proteins, luxR family [Roseibium album]|nr:Bacterial regulatory proteins, luxR family [Roseibium album]